MNIDYYLFTYRDTAASDEIPLGTVFNDGQKTYFCAIGVSDWNIDTEPFSRISEKTNASRMVYEDWIATFKEIEFESRGNPDNFEKAMVILGTNPIGFSVVKDGYIEIPDGMTLEDAAYSLFKELVLQEP